MENVERVEESAEPSRFDSARERLRARREELRHEKTLDLLVGAYNGELGVRYHPIDEERFAQIAKAIRKDQSDLDAAIDLIIEACECILVREGEQLEPLEDGGDAPVKFDQRLAEFLGFEATTARETVRGVFSPDGNHPLAPSTHGLALVNWMQGEDAKIDEELLGN